MDRGVSEEVGRCCSSFQMSELDVQPDAGLCRSPFGVAGRIGVLVKRISEATRLRVVRKQDLIEELAIHVVCLSLSVTVP